MEKRNNLEATSSFSLFNLDWPNIILFIWICASPKLKDEKDKVDHFINFILFILAHSKFLYNLIFMSYEPE